MEATDHIHRPSISLELGSFFTFDPRSGCTWGHTPRVCTFIISNPVTGRQTAPWNSPTVASFPQLKLTFGTLLFEGQYFREDAPESCWAHPQVGVLLTAFSATDRVCYTTWTAPCLLHLLYKNEDSPLGFSHFWKKARRTNIPSLMFCVSM